MKLSDLKYSGHWPTLLTAFLYFDFSFMVWTVLGPLGVQIGETLKLSPEQKGLMVADPILSGAILRILLGLLVDRIGAKRTGLIAQLIVIAGLALAWIFGLPTYEATLLMGLVLGFAGASFAVALPQAGRWYPPHMQGFVMGLAGAGNIGVVLDSLVAPRLAQAFGWRNVFGFALVPAALVLICYALISREAPGKVQCKELSDYWALLRDRDAHWFCFYYTISFGGFVGLASSYVLYFKGEFGLPPVQAGDLAALCTFVGAMLRPVGGATADWIGGVRSLYRFYLVAGLMLTVAALVHNLGLNLALFVAASGSLGMANGAVFQLLPQRFRKNIGVMTGLVGAGGGIGGFYLASSLGFSKGLTGSYLAGFLIFASLCFLAIIGLGLVKTRWHTTWCPGERSNLRRMTNEAIPDLGFTAEQKEYLQGYFAGLSVRLPFAGTLPDGRITNLRGPGLVNDAAEPDAPAEKNVYGTPVSELCEQELWKLEQHGLDIWDKLIAHATEEKFPDKADTFRFRYHGLFYVAPAQNSFMLRCRIPAGELTWVQLRGLADIAQDWGGGYADITTRANIQVREIQPRHLVKCLLKLQEIGLTSRGSGVDNVRNITATPTAGVDKDELIDTRPLAKGVHHYILNNRDLYDLPRKFNVAFDGGGSISVAADTNDIGFHAVRVGEGWGVEPGVYFRVQLAGITGHQQFAKDAGIFVKADECVAVAAAIIRVFVEHGDRTNRNRARLKYLIDSWGIAKFVEEVDKKLAFPLVRFPLEQCEPRHPPILHGHVRVFKQAQRGLNYIGAVITVGRMSTRQMRRLADVAQNYGSGEVRLTVWQNLIIPNIPDAFVETVKKNLVRMGFHYETTTISGGLVACTGNTGCKWSSTNTKDQAVKLARHLEKRVPLDQPINIHLTGCPNSCAQHYMGDIGLLGAKVNQGGDTVEGYHVILGGGFGEKQGVGREILRGVAFNELPALLERVLKTYLRKRSRGETFLEFTRRHSVKELQELFSD